MEIIWLKKILKIEPTTNDDDDDDDDDDDELFLWHGWLTKGVYMCLALFSAGTIVRDPHHCTNLWHATSRIWTCAELEYRLSWMKLYRSDNHLVHKETLNQLIKLAVTF